MNTLKKLLVAAAFLFSCGSVNANFISVSHNIAASGPGSLGYTLFDVSVDDMVTLATGGNQIDPVLFLMKWDGHLDASDILGFNDDCTGCSASGGWNNAGLTMFLTAGSYVAVVGDYALSAMDALTGLNNSGNTAFGVKTGNVQLYLSAPVATIVDPPFVNGQVPEPGTLLLLGLALVLLPVLRLRKR